MSKAFRLGIFVLATLLIFVAGVFWIGSKQFLFDSTYQLTAEFRSVGGLIHGGQVRVGGIHAGSVKRIDLPAQSDGKVRVLMDLKSDTRRAIRKDSTAVIKSEGPVGDKHVAISFGSKEAAEVSEGDVIRSEPTLEMADLMKKTSRILDTADSAMQELNHTVGSLKSISSKIDNGSGTMGALVNDRSVYNHVNAGVNAFRENMEALKHNFLLRGFFKKRGYEDKADLTRDAVAKLPSQAPARKFSYDAGKIFEKPDTAKLKKGKLLDDAGRFLEENRFRLAVVAVSSDRKGDSQEDRVLTQARAMVARDYLVQNFKLYDERVKTIGLGKSHDVQEAGRVDVIVYAPGSEARPGRPPR